MERKIQQLEEKLAWQEHIMDRLNEQIVRLNTEQLSLQRQLQLLYQYIEEIKPKTASFSIEIPPHY